MAMSRHVDIDAMRLLVLVGERGSIGRAATATGITQPSASARLAALERSLGVPLLARDHRGTRLTDEGTAVSGWALRVLDELDALRANVTALRERHEAQLRVGASMTLAEHLVPGGVAQLLGNWEYRAEADAFDRVRAWLADDRSPLEQALEPGHAGLAAWMDGTASPLDVWIVEREQQDPAIYAETWIRDGGTTRGAESDALVDAWLERNRQKAS